MKYFAYLLLFAFHECWSQTHEVALTIDDVPNVKIFQQDKFRSLMLDDLESLNIPIAIFINEKNIYDTKFLHENLDGLKRWLTRKNVTPGNHSYSHINYADTTLEGFQQDIIKGEILTTKITNSRPAYFRFPFNSLGNDSTSHADIRLFLNDRGYIHTPFTIESEDWAYNMLYEDALKKKDQVKARRIGEQYLIHTMNMFQYFETLSKNLYGRNIRHIYLCHDNQLNADFLPQLIKNLRQTGYSFISLERALQDSVYQSKEYYTGRYGFSWIYRWEKNLDKRKMLMRGEPVDEAFRQEYDKLVSQN